MIRTAHSDVNHEEKCFEKISTIRHCGAVESASPPLVKTLTILVSGLPEQTVSNTLRPRCGWGDLSSRKEKDVEGERLTGEKGGR